MNKRQARALANTVTPGVTATLGVCSCGHKQLIAGHCRVCSAMPFDQSDAREAKLGKVAARIRDDEHLAYLLATFPTKQRKTLLEAIRPKLSFTPTHKDLKA